MSGSSLLLLAKAMKIQNFISSSDLLCWNIVLKGNSAKSMTTDNDGNLKVRPPITAEEHQHVQREENARTILLSALPDEHMGDFYHMIDARDIWNAIKARFGLDKGYDKMQKILTQMNTLKIKPDLEDINMKFLRWLPSSWSGIALILKNKRGLEYISFDDMYNKLKFLEIDTKGYSSSSPTLSKDAFVSTAGSSQANLSYQESGNNSYGGYTTTLSASPENFGMIAGIKLESDANSEGEVVSVDVVISADVSISTGLVAAAAVSPQSKTEFALMGLSTEATQEKQDLMTELETNLLIRLSGSIVGRFASVDNMKAVPPPLTGNYMPLFNILDIDESHMVYGKKATDSSEIKTNDDGISYSHDSVLFDFSDSVSAPASASSDTMVIDCDRQEDFPCVCTSSIKTDLFTSHKTFAKRNAEGKGILKSRPTGKPVYPNKPKLVSTGRPNPVSADQPNPVSADQPNSVSTDQPNPVTAGKPSTVSAGDGILGPRPLNIQPQSNKDKLEDFEHFDGGEVTFGGSTVATAFYVLNRVLVTKPHAKTPYELLTRDKPSISYLKPFGCHVTILNTSESLGKFDKKLDEVVPIVDEATTQNDDIKFDLAQLNADNLDELAELQALQKQEQAGKKEADRLGLAFPSLNPMLGVGTSSISSSVSARSTPSVSAGS
nr:ribonuclease H-like domain-containing protein [Tanacetum cinerariifolium]